MGTESFDNRIKDKLQQYNPEFQEQDWKQFAPLLRTQNTWWMRHRAKVTYAAAVLTLLLLSFQNFSLWESNKQLKEALSDKLVSQNSANTVESVVRDTIYIVHDNYIYREQSSAKKSALRSFGIKEDGRSLHKTNNPFSQQKDFLAGEKESTPVHTIQSIKSKEILTDYTSTENIGSETEQNVSEKNIETAVYATDSIASSAAQTDLLLAQSSGETAQAPSIKTPLKKELTQRYNFAGGVSSLFRDDFLAAGIEALYTRGRHFQLAVGLQYGQGFHELFRDNDEFREHHNTDFREKFNQPLPATVKFTDIHSRTHQWSLPVAMYYKHPLHKGLEAFAGVGIAVDLFTAQNYAYQYTENGNPTLRGRLPLQQAGLRLNHLHISTGIQVNVKSLIFRAEPVLILANNLGRFENKFQMEPGLRTAVLYRF